MSYRPTDDIAWNPPADAIVEPLPGKKSVGWEYEDQPPAEHFNWFWNFVTRVFDWLKARATQRIDSFEAATGWVSGPASDTANVSENEIFVIEDPAYNYIVPDWEELLTISLASQATPDGSAIVGGRSLYADGRVVLVALELDGTGTSGLLGELRVYGRDFAYWQQGCPASDQGAMRSVSSNGKHLAVLKTDSGGAAGDVDMFLIRDASLVSELWAFPDPAADGEVDLIGEGWVACSGDGYVNSAASGNDPSLRDRGAANICCCAYGARAFVGGADNAGNVGEIIDITDASAIYVIDRNGSAIRGCCTDGDFLYIAGDADGVTSTSVECYNWRTGDLIWAGTSAGVGANMSLIRQDHEYLYVVDTGGANVTVIPKRNPVTAGGEITIAAIINPGASTIRAIGSDSRQLYVLTDTDLHAYLVPRRPMVYRKVDVRDGAADGIAPGNWRRPFHNVILPGSMP